MLVMKPTTDTVLSVRLPRELDDRLTRASKNLDLSKNDIARHAIRAAIASIEENDHKIQLPLEMIVKNRLVAKVAEPS
jgi:predicted DNA-binding protein